MAKVSVLFDAKALLGEAPFYDKTRNELLWVDIGGKSINFLELDSITNRSIMLSEAAHAAIPCANDDTKLVAVIGRNICLVNRATGQYCAMHKYHVWSIVHMLQQCVPVLAFMLLTWQPLVVCCGLWLSNYYFRRS